MKDEIFQLPLMNRDHSGKTSFNNENDYMSGIIGNNSDDESLSISLPSNGEEKSYKLPTNTLVDSEKNELKKETVRNTLKKQILRILSTDDEDEIISGSEDLIEKNSEERETR